MSGNASSIPLAGMLIALSIAGCGGGSPQAPPTGAAATAPDSPASAPAPAPATAQDFATRCAQPGVVKCVGFDDPSDFSTGSGGVNGAYGYNSGLLPVSNTADYSRAVRDTSVTASGGGSLRFTVPANSTADTSGAYFTNFSTDLSVQFDGNQEFYVQWRQRFSPEFLANFAGGGGFKNVIIGTGDVPGTTVSSCSDLELVATNYYQRGFPILYNSCSGSTSHGPYDGFYQPFGADDFKVQNARQAPYCLYSQRSTGYFPPNGNCFGYVANEWMTFQIGVKLGPRVGDEFKGSYITLWAAREGKASELVIQWGPYNLTAGADGKQRFGKVWLTPYNTGKDGSVTNPVAYTWYDELIISRNRIPDPTTATGGQAVPDVPAESSMPAWRQGMQVGEWRQIPNTPMSAAPIAVMTYPTLGATGPSSKVVAWTGFALDTRDSSLYSAANGGHNDYAGNEVNRLRLTDNAPAWTEPLPSTPPAQVVADATHYADGRPTSRHSCYGEVVNEQRNRVMILGGSRYGALGDTVPSVDGFNLAATNWDAAGTYPDGLDLTSMPCPGIVEQKSTGDVFVFATWNVIHWSSASNTWARDLVGTSTYGQYAATAHDSRRDRILIVGGTNADHAIYTPASKSLQSVTFTGLGASVLGGSGNGMVYDPQLDAYLLRTADAGGTIYQIDASTFEVTDASTTGGTNIPAPQNGVWRRFLYVPALKGTVYVPSYSESIWFLRTY